MTAGGGAGADKSPSAVTVTTVAADRGTLPNSLMVTGSLAARDELLIGTETNGLAIAQVLVDVVDHVRRGQVLVRFNDAVLRAQTQQAEAQLREAEANFTEAEANARRAEELVRTGWLSGKDYDNRHALALTMKARVGVAQANLALARARLDQADLRAPSDGTITSRSASLGAVVQAGNAELFRMIRDDRVELVAELPETDLVLVKAGQPVALTVDGDASGAGKATGQGRIRLIEPTVDVRTRIGKVHIEVGKDAAFRPGMFVTGTVSLGETEAVVVPEPAVVYQDGKPRIFVVDAANRVQARTVVLGSRYAGKVAVLSGVAAGEHLVLKGAGYLKSGDLVTVVETPALADGAKSTDVD
jgi:RND family efflux transporter MFP subunit